MIVFLAPYPDEVNSKDGMVQRVKHVDDLFADERRIYIDVNIRRHFTAKKIICDKTLVLYKMNTFVHIVKLFSLLRHADRIYVHSITGIFNIMPVFPFIESSKFVLDAHGIFPEELALSKSSRFKIFAWIEKLAFKNIEKIICVTESMKIHFKNKYKAYTTNSKFLIYNILPSFNVASDLEESTRTENKINVLYSGNMQAWQNIDLMLDVIKMNDYPDIHYTILTGELEKFRAALDEIALKNASIEILSVKPEELPNYYKNVHYGFILRDDIEVNWVANPTKLIEYLAFGIIPIVKSERIGDFLDLGYEYVHHTESFNTFKMRKSRHNFEIYKRLRSNMASTNLKHFVLNEKS